MRDDQMTVTVRATDLQDLISVARGYTMGRNNRLDKREIIRGMEEILYDASYEHHPNQLDEVLFRFDTSGSVVYT